MNQTDLDQLVHLLSEFFSDPLTASLAAGGGLALLVGVSLVVTKAKRGKRPPAEPQAPQAHAPTPPQAAPPDDIAEIRALDPIAWARRLRQGLTKTRHALQGRLEELFSRQGALDQDTLEELHETLFRSDIGVATSDKLVESLRTALKGQEKNWPTVQRHLHSQTLALLGEPPAELTFPSEGPLVILVVGVNGVGKTTTIGKLAAHFLALKKSVLLCAADTFRAAAIEQLKVWGERLEVKVIAHQQGSDPAAVAYDAVKAAVSRQYEVLIIDTAGRLHSKGDLMAELNKINRVIGKDLPGAPHETWLVVDATTGQNAFEQVKAFGEVVKLTGLVVTKLDGTAKGGVIIGISDQFRLPIRFVGVGEKAADLRPFSPQAYADSLFAAEPN